MRDRASKRTTIQAKEREGYQDKGPQSNHLQRVFSFDSRGGSVGENTKMIVMGRGELNPFSNLSPKQKERLAKRVQKQNERLLSNLGIDEKKNPGISGNLTDSRKMRKRRRQVDLDKKVQEIPAQYAGDIKNFRAFCTVTGQPEDMDAMMDYLDRSMNEERVKVSTWNRRLAAVKKYLTVAHGLEYTDEIREEISKYRKAFRKDEHREQTRIEGQPTADRDSVVKKIMEETEGDTRRRAIALVNLVTANRPSEMVRLRIQDFNLMNHSVRVYLKKQGDWHEKRLTPETVEAVRAYIKDHGLNGDSYFVGAVDRWGNRTEREISEVAYHKMIRGLLDVAPYTLRKTQVTAMHAKGADLATIAKQTGHKSLDTISKHYLTVADSTIDKYL